MKKKDGYKGRKKENFGEGQANDIDNYINEINAYLEEEKPDFTKEKNILEVENQKQKSKKVHTIEVEENPGGYVEQFILKNNNVIEVKDKIFKINEEIKKEIYYDIKLLFKDGYQGKLKKSFILYQKTNILMKAINYFLLIKKQKQI